MRHSKLFWQVKQLCDLIHHSFPDINNGGCGVFAALLGKELQGFGKVHIRVGHYNLYPQTLPNLKSTTVKDWYQKGVYFDHVFVEFGFPSMKPYRGSIPLEIINAIAHQKGAWNPTFNRRDIPTLRKMIREHFKQVKKEHHGTTIKSEQSKGA